MGLSVFGYADTNNFIHAVFWQVGEPGIASIQIRRVEHPDEGRFASTTLSFNLVGVLA